MQRTLFLASHMYHSHIKPAVTCAFESLLGHKIGLWFNFIGTILITSSTAFSSGSGLGGNGKMYPFVVAVRPEWMKLGLGLTVLGFIIQTMEGQSLKMKLVNVAIFLVAFLGVPLIIGTH